MSDADFEYYRRREQHERACAERAQDQTARRVHLDMAERYAARLRTMAPSMAISTAA